MNDLISVIIPVFNAEKTLGPCIDSVLNQTYQNIEILLINDASTDHSAQICEAYAAKHANIQVFSKANAGPSSARNVGIIHAAGQYVGFVDADDYIEKNMYEYLYTNLTIHETQVSVCGWFSHKNGQVLQHGNRPKAQVFSGLDAIYYTIRGGYFDGYLWNKLFDARIFADLRKIKQTDQYLDENIFVCEDLLLCCEIFSICHSVFYDPIPLYHYMINAESAVRSYGKTTRETEMVARQLIIALLRPVDKKLWRLAQFMYTQSALGILISAHQYGNKNLSRRMRQESRIYFLQSLIFSPVDWLAKIKLIVLYLAPVASTRLWTCIKKLLKIGPGDTLVGE